MFNIMLDEYPTEWKGYELNTDFRIGIQIMMASADKELSDYEKTQVCMMLLFKDTYPTDSKEVSECFDWFMNAWCHDNHKSESKTQIMDFDIDQGRIYSAFLSQYNIDLNVDDMHFWKFMWLLSSLEECAFTRVIDIRAKEIKPKMSKEEKDLYVKMKKVYSLNQKEELSEEDKLREKEAVEEFLSFMR